MSKLDRQLDEVYGEESVVIRWRNDEEVDVEEVRRHLTDEIDRHHQRVPLDLRAVDGAPRALIELLLECQVYARAHGKILAISCALPPMQDALSGRPRRKRVKTKDDGTGAAGDLAKKVLETQLRKGDPSDYDISKAKKIERQQKSGKKKGKKRTKKSSGLRRYAILAAAVVGLTAIVGAIEYYVLFSDMPDAVQPPKAFESLTRFRTWTDSTGQFEMIAILTKVEGDKVFLRRKDGTTVSIEFSQLSEDDQTLLRAQKDQIGSPFLVE